jgi:hypothetical protein
MLLNANGLTQLLLPLNIMGMKSVYLIQEWNPSTPSFSPLFYVILLATLAVIVLKGVKVRVGEALLLLFLLGWAFSQIHHQSWLVIVASMVLAPLLAGPMPEVGPLFSDARSRRFWIGGALAAIAMVLLLRLWTPFEPKHSQTTPQKLLAHVPPELRTQPVFNDYGFGGPLILAGIRPYIDGRADMYGDKFFLNWWDIVNGDMQKFDGAVSKYDIRWTLLDPKEPLVKQLDASPNWRRLYSDKVGVIHVRR